MLSPCLGSPDLFSTALRSAMLRSASASVPVWRARASVSACSGLIQA